MKDGGKLLNSPNCLNSYLNLAMKYFKVLDVVFDQEVTSNWIVSNIQNVVKITPAMKNNTISYQCHR